MGTLTLPSGGSVYLDTSAIIYSIEWIEPYLTLLAPAWQAAEAGMFFLVCSEIAIAETLVGPMRDGDRGLEKACRDVFAAPEVQILPATRQLWEEAARLRAETGLKLADALHAATALWAGCSLFVTNDADFRRIEGLLIVVLDDLLGEGLQPSSTSPGS